MTTATRPVSVTVRLAPTLFETVESITDVVHRGVEEQLSELAADLGVAARPTVVLEASELDGAEDLVRVFANDSPCPFSRPTVAEALAYAEETPKVAMESDAVLERLRGLEASQAELVAEVLGLVVRTAVSSQPGILLGPTADASLGAALDLGMSIAGGNGRLADPEGGDSAELAIAAHAGPTVDVHVDPEYLRFLADTDPEAEKFPFLRDGLFVELGLRLPPFHFRPDATLRPGAFAFRINSVRTLPRVGLPRDTILVNDTAERLAQLYETEAEPTLNPATDQPGALVATERKTALEQEGLTTWEPLNYLILCLAAALRRRAHAFMTRSVASDMLQEIGYVFPALTAAASAHVKNDVLTQTLRELLLDGVSIRNLRRILELLVRYETIDDREDRPDRMVFVRAGLADLLAHQAARGTATVVVYLLDQLVEEAFTNTEGTTAPGVADALHEQLRAAVRAEYSHLPPTAMVPALLTQDAIRRSVRDALRHEFPQMRVQGYSDLPPDRNVQPVARISWQA